MNFLLPFGFALAFIAVPAWGQESLLDVVLKRDKLIVATYSTSPPLAYVDDNGKLVGFEIDMAHEIAKDLLGDPDKLELVVVQSDGRFPAALSGKIDFGLCSTTITPDRAVRIAFTRPYLDTGGSVIARKDAGIKTVKELNDPKFTYAILNVPPAIARAKQVMPEAKLLLLDSPSALFLAVKTGRAQAFAIDKPIADFYEAENQDLVRLDTSGTPFAYSCRVSPQRSDGTESSNPLPSSRQSVSAVNPEAIGEEPRTLAGSAGGWGREKGRAGCEPGLLRPFSLTGTDAVPPPKKF
jgi:ABC-type amino acid transport substrate-binding protein